MLGTKNENEILISDFFRDNTVLREKIQCGSNADGCDFASVNKEAIAQTSSLTCANEQNNSEKDKEVILEILFLLYVLQRRLQLGNSIKIIELATT